MPILKKSKRLRFGTGNNFNQSKGIYILTIVNENGLVFREKISKI